MAEISAAVRFSVRGLGPIWKDFAVIKLFALMIGTAATTFASTCAWIGDVPEGTKLVPPFKIVFVHEIELKSGRTGLLSQVKKTDATALRDELTADRTVSDKLRARGIRIWNIVGRRIMAKGRVTYTSVENFWHENSRPLHGMNPTGARIPEPPQ